MGKLLSGLLFGSGIFLNSCIHVQEPDFDNVKWVSVPSHEEGVWNSYLKESIRHSPHNWAIYQQTIKRENNFEGDWKNYDKAAVLLPDLDGDGFVTSGKERYSVR